MAADRRNLWLACACLLALSLSPRDCLAQSEGASLYAEQCASCHGAFGQGSSVAPPLIGKSAADVHFMLDTGRMPAAVSYEQEMHKPAQFTYLQIGQIVDYVMSLSPRSDRALPLLERGNVEHGRALFAQNCQACHGVTGSGASVGYAMVAPSLSQATVFQVAEAIRVGPGVMPRFGSDVLSARDVDDIAWYVNHLQTQPDNPGGLALANIGPVAEGFVAWVFGIGLLVFFVRQIGTTD